MCMCVWGGGYAGGGWGEGGVEGSVLGERALKEVCRGLGRYQFCMSNVKSNLIEVFKTRPPTLRETHTQKKSLIR